MLQWLTCASMTKALSTLTYTSNAFHDTLNSPMQLYHRCISIFLAIEMFFLSIASLACPRPSTKCATLTYV